MSWFSGKQIMGPIADLADQLLDGFLSPSLHSLLKGSKLMKIVPSWISRLELD